MDWDSEGRLWVVEMPGFVPNLQARSHSSSRWKGRCPRGHEQGRRDGQAHRLRRRSRAARSLKVLDRGVLVAEPPHAWLMRDTNGDLKMDTKESITDRYGRREARVEQNANSSSGAWTTGYTSESDIQLRLKDLKFEARRTLPRGNGRHAGRRGPHLSEHQRVIGACRFRADAVFHAQPGAVAHARQLRGLRDEENNVNTVWPVRPNPGTNRAYQSGIDRPTAPGQIHCGVRAADLSRRPSARRAVGQRLRRGTRGQSRGRTSSRTTARCCAHARRYGGEFLARPTNGSAPCICPTP